MTTIAAEDLDFILSADLPWERLDGKTVLITGASGFLPSFVVETLLRRNQQTGRTQTQTQVIGLVRDEEKACRRFAAYAGRSDLRFLVQDVSQPVPPEIQADFLIHAASQASPKYYASDPVGTLSANIFGTFHLLQAAIACKSERLLFLSSGEVYGQVEAGQTPTREDQYGYLDPMQVRACYAESKRMSETMCVSWAHQYGVDALVVRPFHTYGPGMALDDGRVFADFVADIIAGRDIVMKSDGRAERAFCYLSDAVRGFFTVLLRGESKEAYNIGNSEATISVAGLAETLTGLFPERGLRVIRQSAPAGYLASPIVRNCPDTAKARALGWSPTIGIAEGFRRTVRSFEHAQEDV